MSMVILISFHNILCHCHPGLTGVHGNFFYIMLGSLLIHLHIPDKEPLGFIYDSDLLDFLLNRLLSALHLLKPLSGGAHNSETLGQHRLGGGLGDSDNSIVNDLCIYIVKHGS